MVHLEHIVRARELNGYWYQARGTHLMSALLLLLITYPFLLDQTFRNRLILGLLNVSILLTAAHAMVARWRTFLLVVLFLGVPTLVLQAGYLLTNNAMVGDALALVYSVFYVFTIAHVLRYVLAPGAVTRDKIFSAIAIYIIMGLLWATIYMFVNNIYPGAFSYNGKSDQLVLLRPTNFIYFSFTTLTSTGYGDVVPRIAHAQALAILEQLAGVFYIAILIARLTGLYEGGVKRRLDKG